MSRRRRILHDPLFHFVVLGSLVYAAGELWPGADESRAIVVCSSEVRGIVSKYEMQHGSPPTAQQLNALIEQYVREEILYREGVALGLAEEDEIVRRRIVQKVEFLQEDLTIPDEPTEGRLQVFFDSHRARYDTPERVSFSHIYFSSGAEDEGRRRAAGVLPSLASRKVRRAPQLGDRFSDMYDYASLSRSDVTRLFGNSQLAAELFQVPLDRWAGPFRSGFGWHLVYVAAHEAPGSPAYAQVRDLVRNDYLQQQNEAANDAAFREIARKYVVRVERDNDAE